jgi:hypothetical protein
MLDNADVKEKHPYFHYLFIRNWHPVTTYKQSVIIYSLFGFFFFILGISVSVQNSDLQEIRIENYQDTCLDSTAASTNCTIKVNLQSEMQKPILVYY